MIIAAVFVVAGSTSAPVAAASCVLPRPPHSTSQAAPERSLLSSFAVLRRTRKSGDYLSPQRYLSFNQEVFVRYIRRTQVVAGTAYYLIPAIFTTCKPGPAYWGITFKVLAASGEGPGAATLGPAARAEQDGLFLSSGNGGPSSSVAGLVPDPVASVTLSYRATAHQRAVQITAKVVDNVVVFNNIPRNAAAGWAMIWRAANGAIIKRLY